MSRSYAGAKEAIKARLLAGFTAHPVTFENEGDPDAADSDGNPTLWVFVEILASGGTDPETFGVPGDQWWVYDGTIRVNVHSPKGAGAERPTQVAETIGELFRNARFYDEEPPAHIRTMGFSPPSGGAEHVEGVGDGNWYRVTTTIPFEYWHAA